MIVGLDLSSGREVSSLSEFDVPRWHRKGYSGDRTLVCLHCFVGAGCEQRRVPLIVKGRVGGKRRAHFAHPAGMAPLGGVHAPETIWHSTGKQYLAAWARTQPRVGDVVVEARTADGRRRSDVRVRLRDGQTVALELQSDAVSDVEWLDRHDDYRRAGISDVWLWHPRAGVPGIVHHNGMAGWIYGPDHNEMHAVVAEGHQRPNDWRTQPDAGIYFPHWPAHVGDRLRRVLVSMEDLAIDSSGLVLPDRLAEEWATAAAGAIEVDARQSPLDRRLDSADPVAAGVHVGEQLWSRRPASAGGAAQENSCVRIDAQPPNRSLPELERYLCRICGTEFGRSDACRHFR